MSAPVRKTNSAVVNVHELNINSTWHILKTVKIFYFPDILAGFNYSTILTVHLFLFLHLQKKKPKFLFKSLSLSLFVSTNWEHLFLTIPICVSLFPCLWSPMPSSPLVYLLTHYFIASSCSRTNFCCDSLRATTKEATFYF